MYTKKSLEPLILFANKKCEEIFKPFEIFKKIVIDYVKQFSDIILYEDKLYIDIEKIMMHAKAITQLCFDADAEVQYKFFTRLNSIVSDRILVLQVRGRNIFTLIALPRHRKLSIKTAIITIPHPEHSEILTFGYELRLLDILMKLSDPTYVDDWDELAKKENEYRNIWKNTKLEITSLDADNDQSVVEKIEGGADTNFIQIFTTFLKGGERALISDLGASRIKIVTGLDLNAEAKLLSELLESKGHKIEMTYDHPNIPVDPRLRKVTLRYLKNDKRIPFCDIYNCANYSLIGCNNEKNILVAKNLTKLRILIVDYWIAVILYRMNMIQENFAKILCENFKREYFETSLDNFESDTYIGKLYDYNLYLKRSFKDKFIAPYIPACILRAD